MTSESDVGTAALGGPRHNPPTFVGFVQRNINGRSGGTRAIPASKFESSNMDMKTPLATALVLCVLSTVTLAADTLSAQDIRKLAPGRYAVSLLGLVNMTVAMRPNGAIVGHTKEGKRDTGVWSVQGQKLCVSWSKWLNGQRKCTSLRGDKGSYSGGGMSMRRI
jgi:hypothetical protein